MDQSFFSDKYPDEIPQYIDETRYESVVSAFLEFTASYAKLPAFTALGQTLSYLEVENLSRDFAAYLQNDLGLQPGDRVAVQLPNLLQYPIAVFGILRAGLILVNTNPLYTPEEMLHQFTDAGVKVLVILANMADKAEKIIDKTDIEHVIITEIADLHAPIKRFAINNIVKHVKKMVPKYDIACATTFRSALAKGKSLPLQPVDIKSTDIAVLQYTGGTTGVSKGVELRHQNIVANMLQSRPAFESVLPVATGEVVIGPLPLYHIYAFMVHCMVVLSTGNHNVIIPNPKDIPGFVKELTRWQVRAFIGLNTLFVALCNNDRFRKDVDFSRLKLTVSGGMALTHSACEAWMEVTGCGISEGYGLSEASPVVCYNPPNNIIVGTVGLPAPSTEIQILDENGNVLGLNEPGELCAKGPQVMQRYWKHEKETALVLSADGWLKTGDIALIRDDGYIEIVDRKKDMIIVSGFNVYPNEVEDLICGHHDIAECAAIGIPDETCGEIVKLFVVSQNSSLTESDVLEFAKSKLTAYKRPRIIEFRDELPKSNVGKVLRKKLRDEAVNTSPS